MTDLQQSRVYLGLGANLGDPIEQLIKARRLLFAEPTLLRGRSSCFYQSSPVGDPDQNDFINCVIALDCILSPSELLKTTQRIEKLLGRKRDPNNRNAARVIDIDILLIGDLSIQTHRLIVPHPRMWSRLFVLRPLLDVADEKLGDKLRDLLARDVFADQRVSKLAF